MEHKDQKRSGVLGFAAKVLDEAGGAVVDVYDLGSIAVNNTSFTLKKVPVLTKKIKVKGAVIMEYEDQKRSGVLGFVAKVLNEAGGAVVDAYDLGSTAVNKTSSTLKKAPVLTEKAKGIITSGLEAIKPTKTKKVVLQEKEPIKESEAFEEYKIKEKEEKPKKEKETAKEHKHKIKEKKKKETNKEAKAAKEQDKVKEDKTKDLPETSVKAEVVRGGEPSEPEPISTPVETTEPEIISSKTTDVAKPSRPLKLTFSKERLKKMVKPQLISLCKDLNIECDYTDTKDQIIAKILNHQGVTKSTKR